MPPGAQMRSFFLAILSFFSALRTALLPSGLALLAATQAAHAFSLFTGVDANVNAAETAFLAQLLGVGTETFERFAPGTTTPLTLSFPGAGLATLTQMDGTILLVAAGITNGLGRYGISPTNFLSVDADANLNNNNLRITFADPIAAFGFYGLIAAISLAPLRS